MGTSVNGGTRIGVARNPENSAKPRPIILELPSKRDKWQLIKKANEENRKSLELTGINIKLDLTKQHQHEEF